MKIISSILSGTGKIFLSLPLQTLPSDVPVEEMTIWEELWNYFYYKYFLSFAGTYDNFTIGDSSAMTIAIVIVGFIIGMVSAVAVSYFRNRTSGRIVRALLLNRAFSEGDAKTLSELGIDASLGVKLSLQSRSFLRKYVHYVGEPTYSSNAYRGKRTSGGEGDSTFSGYNPYVRDVIDYEKARFYIPDEIHYSAEVRYEQKGIGDSPIVVVVSIVALVAFGFFCLRFAPVLLKMTDNLINMIS